MTRRALLPVLSIGFASLFSILLLTSAPMSAQASEGNTAETSAVSSPAEQFVSGLADKVLAIAGQTDASAEDTEKAYRDVLNEGFAIRHIGEFVLGRFRKKASDEEIETFMTLFQDMIVTTYSRQFSEYSDAKVEVISSREDTDGSQIVESRIMRESGEPIRVDWKVGDMNGSLKVIDVLVEGVSMSVTQRQEYASVMRSRGGVGGLNEALAKKLGK